jgi:hypothetical protein
MSEAENREQHPLRYCACGAAISWHSDSDRCGICRARDSKNNRDPDLQMPPEWANLPESTDPRGDLLWAYNNHMHIKRRPGKESLIYWGRMTTPPTRAASAQILFYDSNPKGFQDRLDRAVGEGDTADPELRAEARRQIAEINRILEQFKAKRT